MKQTNQNQGSPHVTSDELFSYMDGDLRRQLSSAKKSHIENCAVCQGELKSFSRVGDVLFSHADTQPRDEVWNKLQVTLYGDQIQGSSISELGKAPPSNLHELRPVSAPAPYQSLSKAIYALAASVAFVGVVAVFMLSGQQSSDQQTQLMQASINELMSNSRSLEQSLQTVVLQNRALSEANQQVVDRLYWKLSYVDQLIHEVTPDDSERVEGLWNDRVEALNELKQIYFEQKNARKTSEI